MEAVTGKRPAEEVLGNQAKHQAGLFRGLSRQDFVQQRIHRRLHVKAQNLKDEDLLNLGEMSFNQQFIAIGQMSVAGGGDGNATTADGLFGDLGFDGFMKQHVHRKLWQVAEKFAPEKLLELGQLSFNEQFQSLGMPGPVEEKQAQQMESRSVASSLFGPVGRSGYLHQRVHRKLHPYVIALSDKDLFDLGKLTFNEQFNVMGQESPAEGGFFDDLGREGYIQRHVHRKLHASANAMSDEDLFNLGKLSFNEQFAALGETGDPSLTAFGAQDREAYIKAHVHRKLHMHVAGMSDEDVLRLGKLGFNEQFRTLGVDTAAPQIEQQAMPFGMQSREAYVAAHVHRKLHQHITAMSDQDVAQLGKLSFNEQFLGVDMMSQPIEYNPLMGAMPGAAPAFGGLDRNAYIQARIHRKLHMHAAAMSDEDVMRLGKQSFNEQFRAVGAEGPGGPAAGMAGGGFMGGKGMAPVGPMLRGLSRQAYMQQRVHRKLHAQAAYLSNEQLMAIGELSFNDQFGAVEAARAQSNGTHEPRLDLFGGLDRTSFLMQRVHRRLHSRAAKLTDEDLARLGKLSFNEQFPMLDGWDGLQGAAQ